MITLYGIPGCDTVKKARKWLDAHAIAYIFHDYKKQGAPQERLQEWVSVLGCDTVLNKRGTTWRKLSEAIKTVELTDTAAVDLMVEHTSLIKRPILEGRGMLMAGFDEARYGEAFARAA